MTDKQITQKLLKMTSQAVSCVKPFDQEINETALCFLGEIMGYSFILERFEFDQLENINLVETCKRIERDLGDFEDKSLRYQIYTPYNYQKLMLTRICSDFFYLVRNSLTYGDSPDGEFFGRFSIPRLKRDVSSPIRLLLQECEDFSHFLVVSEFQQAELASEAVDELIEDFEKRPLVGLVFKCFITEDAKSRL